MRRDLGPNVLFNTVMMVRVRSRRTVLLTESPNDAQFYQKFVSSSDCFVGAADGRRGVLEMLDRFASCKVEACVGIIDADGDHLLGRPKPSPLVFLTDKADKETTIVDSKAFEDFCSALGAGRPAEELRTLLYDAAFPLAAIRRFAGRSGMAVDFRGISFRTFIDRDTICNRLKCCAEVRSLNPDLEFSIDDLVGVIDEANLQGVPRALLVRGHDLLQILEMNSPRLIGRVASLREIERGLEDAFKLIHFHATILYADLRQWEETVSPQYRMFS